MATEDQIGGDALRERAQARNLPDPSMDRQMARGSIRRRQAWKCSRSAGRSLTNRF